MLECTTCSLLTCAAAVHAAVCAMCAVPCAGRCPMSMLRHVDKIAMRVGAWLQSRMVVVSCMILAPRIAKAGVNGTPPHVRGRLTAIHPSSSPMGLSTTERFCSTLPVSSGDVCIASALSARTMHAAEASAATCVVCGVKALSLGRSFPPGALGSGCMRDGDALMVDGGTGASGALPLPCAPCRAMS